MQMNGWDFAAGSLSGDAPYSYPDENIGDESWMQAAMEMIPPNAAVDGLDDFEWPSTNMPSTSNDPSSHAMPLLSATTSNGDHKFEKTTSSAALMGEGNHLEHSDAFEPGPPPPAPMRHPARSLSAPVDPTTVSTAGCGQSCLSNIVRLVQQNSYIPRACSQAPTKSSGSGDARDVDAVLFQNREAVRVLNRALDCACASQPSVVLSAYLLISSMVAWYRAVLDIQTTSPEPQRHDSISGKIIANPIFLGTFCLDAEAQRNVRARIVLAELRSQVQPLLAKMPQFYSSPTGTAETATLPPLDAQRCMVREQLQAVVAEARRLGC
jgi:hypothetical protein